MAFKKVWKQDRNDIKVNILSLFSSKSMQKLWFYSGALRNDYFPENFEAIVITLDSYYDLYTQ